MSEQKSTSSSRTTTYGYHVEARVVSPLKGHEVVGGQVVTESWRELQFDRGQIGVPNQIWDPVADQHGVFTFEAASALMAWAAAAHRMRAVEFRLRKLRVESTCAIYDCGVSAPVCFLERERATEFSPDAALLTASGSGSDPKKLG